MSGILPVNVYNSVSPSERPCVQKARKHLKRNAMPFHNEIKIVRCANPLGDLSRGKMESCEMGVSLAAQEAEYYPYKYFITVHKETKVT